MKTFLYSVPIMGSDSFLGLWAGPDYVPRTATSPRARGRIELRVMGLPTGGLFQRKVWPRRTMLADQAIEFADEVRNTFFEGFTFDKFKAHCEWQVRNFYFGAHA